MDDANIIVQMTAAAADGGQARAGDVASAAEPAPLIKNAGTPFGFIPIPRGPDVTLH